jgi:hypothetical protein
MFGDGTTFGNLDIKTIISELQRVGYESYGNEIMYNGLTGEQMESSIFISPVYYQRLKHMVSDKQHSRSIGPMIHLTRQPAEGVIFLNFAFFFFNVAFFFQCRLFDFLHFNVAFFLFQCRLCCSMSPFHFFAFYARIMDSVSYPFPLK